MRIKRTCDHDRTRAERVTQHTLYRWAMLALLVVGVACWLAFMTAFFVTAAMGQLDEGPGTWWYVAGMTCIGVLGGTAMWIASHE